jgi:3-dehydroquinate synthase
MIEISVSSAAGGYSVTVGRGIAAELAARISADAGASPAVVIADANTGPLLGRRLAEGLGAICFEIPPGESSKTLAWVERAASAAVGAGVDRGSTLVAVGGGVVGDLAGVVAATLLRGIRLVHVPTTLLAQVDSAIGGKAAVDLPEGKNLVGAFKSPVAVYVDPELLIGLPEREFKSGLAEVIKYGVALDEELFTRLRDRRAEVERRDLETLTAVVERCCAIKARVVSADEEERGERAVLNYGHTVGHALEAATGYTRFSHGEAISVGMAAACAIGVNVGLTPAGVEEQQRELLDSYGLPFAAVGAATTEQVLALVARDKKARGGEVPWVLLEALGRATPGHRVPPDVVAQAVDRVLAEVG